MTCKPHNDELNQKPMNEDGRSDTLMYTRQLIFLYKFFHSGSRSDRPAFQKLMKDAKQRQFDVLLVWKLDRFSRSLKDLINNLELLKSLNIQFISFTEALDTTTPQGQLMFNIIGSFAQFERELIRERVKQGLKIAKMKGKVLGRPKIKINKYKVMNLKNQGLSYREIAKELNSNPTTIYRILSKI